MHYSSPSLSLPPFPFPPFGAGTRYRNDTGELLCREDPVYGGTGKLDNPKWDEKGYAPAGYRPTPLHVRCLRVCPHPVGKDYCEWKRGHQMSDSVNQCAEPCPLTPDCHMMWHHSPPHRYILQPPCLWGDEQFGLQAPPDVTGVTLHTVKTSYANAGHHGEMAWQQMFFF